jgi:phenylacetate-CoA ligase
MAIGKKQDEYFDKLETMSREEREQYLNGKLSRAVAYAYRHAPAIREMLANAGVKPSQIKSARDMEKLPITRKTDLIDMQKKNPPFGGILTVPVGEVERVFISPGPVYEIQSSDIKWFARSMWAAGFRKGDMVINTFTYHMSPAGILFHEAIRHCGATVVVSGTGNTDMQIQIMRDLRVTGFVGTPSFLMTVIKRAEEMGIDFKRDLAVNKSWFTGEMLSPSLRQTFEHDYHISTSQAYAVTEPGGAIAYECYQKAGMHFMDDYLIEIVDPQTGKQLGPGEVGEIVVTPLHHQAWGLFRFGTGDLSSFITEPCPCGRTAYRLTGIVGRTGDAVKVRGMFVVGRQAEQAISSFEQLGQYQLVITRQQQRDEMTLKAELKGELAEEGKKRLSDDLNKRFQDACRVRLDRIEFVKTGTIPPDSKKIVDERKWE